MNQKNELKETLQQFREKLGEIHDVSSAASVLQWDMETYMPPKGAQARGEQLSTLASIAHRLFTDEGFGHLLTQLNEQKDALEPDERKLIEETHYDHRRATCLPDEFVREMTLLESQSYEAWVKARNESNFTLFQPYLERLVEMLRRKADYLGYEGTPYNALLEDFERGMTTDRLQSIFSRLAQDQSQLVERIQQAGRPENGGWAEGTWPTPAQLQLSEEVLREMGYDLQAGRQDLSVHPFSTHFDMQDVRVTTRVDESDLFSALLSSMHEGGHALYEQGLPLADRRTTLGESISLGIHESQSRLWENAVGRSLAFWQWMTPRMQAAFPGRLDAVTPEQIYRRVNRVEPSLIRVEADECTYNLHIIVRFEIERALIEGELAVKDVPDAWNEKIKQYLGLDVPNDAQGCLQDIHWSHGAMGYFPTYALGNLYAAQLLERIESDLPDLWQQVQSGKFDALLDWLREKIHRVGRRMTAVELIESVTGKPPGSEAYLRYLWKKYGAIYDIN